MRVFNLSPCLDQIYISQLIVTVFIAHWQPHIITSILPLCSIYIYIYILHHRLDSRSERKTPMISPSWSSTPSHWAGKNQSATCVCVCVCVCAKHARMSGEYFSESSRRIAPFQRLAERSGPFCSLCSSSRVYIYMAALSVHELIDLVPTPPPPQPTLNTCFFCCCPASSSCVSVCCMWRPLALGPGQASYRASSHNYTDEPTCAIGTRPASGAQFVRAPPPPLRRGGSFLFCSCG